MKNSVPSPAFGTAQGPAQQPAVAATRGKRARIELARLRDLALLPALALLLVIGAFVSPSFLTKANLISVGCVRGVGVGGAR
jgi:simple sugar transport system permease protein